MKGRLEHAISGEAVAEWKTMDEIEVAVDIDMGDYVVHNDWVGQVRAHDIANCRGMIELVLFVGRRGTSTLPDHRILFFKTQRVRG